MNINYELIGKRIGEVRRCGGMTQEELAEICDVSARFISLVETGRKMASLKMLVSICDALSISLDEMVFGNQTGRKTDKEVWAQIIADCTWYEKEILRDMAKSLKVSLREHGSIRTQGNDI